MNFPRVEAKSGMQGTAGPSDHFTHNIIVLLATLSWAFFMCLIFLLFNLKLRLIARFLQLELSVLFKIH